MYKSIQIMTNIPQLPRTFFFSIPAKNNDWVVPISSSLVVAPKSEPGSFHSCQLHTPTHCNHNGAPKIINNALLMARHFLLQKSSEGVHLSFSSSNIPPLCIIQHIDATPSSPPFCLACHCEYLPNEYFTKTKNKPRGGLSNFRLV